jgi:hypothetical protein
MSKAVLEPMHPAQEGTVHCAGLQKGIGISYFTKYCLFILHIYYIFAYTEKDDDPSVEFYWIDPLFSAERIPSRSNYSGHVISI